MAMMEQPEAEGVRPAQRTNFLAAVPLLGFVVIAYVAFAWAGADFTLPRFNPTMPSGGVWPITLGDMLLTGARFDARHAHRIGFLQELVPKGEALARALEAFADAA